MSARRGMMLRTWLHAPRMFFKPWPMNARACQMANARRMVRKWQFPNLGVALMRSRLPRKPVCIR